MLAWKFDRFARSTGHLFEALADFAHLDARGRGLLAAEFAARPGPALIVPRSDLLAIAAQSRSRLG